MPNINSTIILQEGEYHILINIQGQNFQGFRDLIVSANVFLGIVCAAITFILVKKDYCKSFSANVNEVI